ncbi:MAG: HisA/HisF-related TIM barrel protein [Methylococcales bacterium]|nr:HisA/HisF-related TIM barrel protein [Methylococcales bacterium]
MKIIPVIDLKDGVVVLAQQGRRNDYQPINTPLCASPDIVDVINAYLSLGPFDTFYIADLNAIMRQGDHTALIAKVLAAFPTHQFWIDSGYQQHPQNYAANHTPVLGSECYGEESLAILKGFGKRFILSLDYGQTEALGATSLFTNPALWPDTVIIMTLSRVGSHQGPDVEKLSQYCRQHPNTHFVAAGGIRDNADLQTLDQLGIQHALVASALHSGAIVPVR